MPSINRDCTHYLINFFMFTFIRKHALERTSSQFSNSLRSIYFWNIIYQFKLFIALHSYARILSFVGRFWRKLLLHTVRHLENLFLKKLTVELRQQIFNLMRNKLDLF